MIRVDPVASGTQWLYKTPHVWVGQTVTEPTTERAYLKHLACDEIQYQVSGRRTLITQRGMVRLEPGEMVSVPLGCSFASICDERSDHISILVRRPVSSARPAERRTEIEALASYR